MKNFYLLAAALLFASCIDEPGDGSGESGRKETFPEDFYWETTSDVDITVAMPQTDGASPDYAVVRVYSSPVLSDRNLIARGAVTPASPVFRTAATIPAGAQEIYVRTTLPDGTSAVRSAAAAGNVVFGAPLMQSVRAEGISLLADGAPKATSMPTDYPALDAKTLSDFSDSRTVIRTNPASKYKLGAEEMQKYGGVGAPAYYIPAGASITGNIDFEGGYAPYPNPVLYVAGKLTLSEAELGQVTLAVLDGGEVYIKDLDMGDSNTTPAIYVFKGGKLSAEDAEISRPVVNFGQVEIEEDIEAEKSAVVYNMTGATMSGDEVKFSNGAVLYNDGVLTFKELKLEKGSSFENCENGDATFEKCDLETGSTEFYQKGRANIEKMEVEGRLYVSCYTYVKKLEGDNGKIYLAGGTCLESRETELDNTHVDMAPGSLFLTQIYNADEENGNTKFTNNGGDGEYAVVRIEQKAVSKKGHHTDFKGPIEVVYLGEGGKLEASSFKPGAYLVNAQTVNISATECNGAMGQISPEPEPEPEAEYALTTGRTMTWCFEDRWPWIGDYDMNDVVLVCRTDREVSKDGSKVRAMTINWSLVAAGTQVDLGCAVQLDKVQAAQVADVVSTHTLGAGFFAADGLESGNELAVIPFFNRTGELLGSSNTYPGQPYSQPAQHTTTIRFAQPVDIADVCESAMNCFIVVGDRSKEIHRPGQLPTRFGVVGEGQFREDDPYRFYEEQGKHSKDNHLMWALLIPAEFRYPAEGVGHDIRDVYTYFSAWALSGGTQYADWYEDEANEKLLY